MPLPVTLFTVTDDCGPLSIQEGFLMTVKSPVPAVTASEKVRLRSVVAKPFPTKLACGGVGRVVSIVIASVPDAAETLPAKSVCFTVSVCTPAASTELVILHAPAPSATFVPSTVVPSVSYSVTVALASAPVPVTVGVVSLVRLSVVFKPKSEAASRSGAESAETTVSILIARVPAAETLPAASVAVALSVSAP